MANEPSKTPTPQPQTVPLSKIHNLPGAVISKQPDKSYGGLVTSIQAGGVKEPVVLRPREDGEYQLVTGYRRRRACELAKLKDIPALVHEMSMPAALNYHRQVKNQPDIPIPSKPVLPATPDKKRPEKPTKPAAAQDQEKPNQGKGPAQATAAAVTGPAAKGPAGTTISQVLPERLSPPDEAAQKDFPAPKEDESIFVVLHPAYLEKSEYNTVSVDNQERGLPGAEKIHRAERHERPGAGPNRGERHPGDHFRPGSARCDAQITVSARWLSIPFPQGCHAPTT